MSRKTNLDQMKKSIIVLFLALFVLIIHSCEKEGGQNETKISRNNDTKSHNMGQNCMLCHKSGGKGEGWFNVAGTVYNETFSNTYPNKLIQLYTEPNGAGQLKYTIEVDAKGNFYTTESINFGSGLYPAAVGNTTTKFMGSSITQGQCNSCHGNTNEKIWTK